MKDKHFRQEGTTTKGSYRKQPLQTQPPPPPSLQPQKTYLAHIDSLVESIHFKQSEQTSRASSANPTLSGFRLVSSHASDNLLPPFPSTSSTISTTSPHSEQERQKRILSYGSRRFFARGSFGTQGHLILASFIALYIPAAAFLLFEITYPSSGFQTLLLLPVIWIIAITSIIIISIVLFLSTSLSDPGFIAVPLTKPERERLPSNQKKNERQFQLRFCETCGIFKPLRAHHCKVCDLCVLERDHHCPFLNNCIGVRNRRKFLLFLLSCVILELVILAETSFQVGTALFRDSSFVNAISRPSVIFAFIQAIYAMIVAANITQLLLFQLKLAVRNSTIDEFRRLAAKQPSANDLQIHTEFDEGCWRNLYSIFINRIDEPAYTHYPQPNRPYLVKRYYYYLQKQAWRRGGPAVEAIHQPKSHIVNLALKVEEEEGEGNLAASNLDHLPLVKQAGLLAKRVQISSATPSINPMIDNPQNRLLVKLKKGNDVLPSQQPISKELSEQKQSQSRKLLHLDDFNCQNWYQPQPQQQQAQHQKTQYSSMKDNIPPNMKLSHSNSITCSNRSSFHHSNIGSGGGGGGIGSSAQNLLNSSRSGSFIDHKFILSSPSSSRCDSTTPKNLQQHFMKVSFAQHVNDLESVEAPSRSNLLAAAADYSVNSSGGGAWGRAKQLQLHSSKFSNPREDSTEVFQIARRENFFKKVASITELQQLSEEDYATVTLAAATAAAAATQKNNEVDTFTQSERGDDDDEDDDDDDNDEDDDEGNQDDIVAEVGQNVQINSLVSTTLNRRQEQLPPRIVATVKFPLLPASFFHANRLSFTSETSVQQQRRTKPNTTSTTSQNDEGLLRSFASRDSWLTPAQFFEESATATLIPVPNAVEAEAAIFNTSPSRRHRNLIKKLHMQSHFTSKTPQNFTSATGQAPPSWN